VTLLTDSRPMFTHFFLVATTWEIGSTYVALDVAVQMAMDRGSREYGEAREYADDKIGGHLMYCITS
jgi:hypothetical protein